MKMDMFSMVIVLFYFFSFLEASFISELDVSACLL